MGKFSRIPASTFSELQVDAGVVLKTFDPTNPAVPEDEAIVCATTGGIKPACVPVYSDWGEDVDNCPKNTKELKHLDGWNCTLAFTALGASPEVIRLALGAADIDSATSKITPEAAVNADGDFTDLWWVGDRSDGGVVAIRIMNALSTGGFSMQTAKNGKGQISVTITGHVSIDDQDTVPMEFYSIAGEGLTEA